MKQKSIEVLKAFINISLKAGVFENLEMVAGVNNAFNYLASLPDHPQENGLVTDSPNKGNGKKLKAVPPSTPDGNQSN